MADRPTTDAWGVDDGYWDIDANWHEAPAETKRALRVAMGGLADVPDPPPHSRPVWFVRHGSAPAMQRPAVLELEDGAEVHAGDSLPADLPLGYHDLHPNDGGPTTRVIVTPDRCALPAALRTWGWSSQLYATRSNESWGIGDLADLRRLATLSGRQGAGVLAINPLHAALPLPRQEASPYFPSSRRFRNPLYLHIEDVPGFDPTDPVLANAAAAGRALNADRLIDRDAVHALKLAALEHLWARRGGAHDGEGADRDLDLYATFCALAEHHGTGWRLWPGEHRRPESPGVDRFRAAHSARLAFHRWVQRLIDAQLSAAAASARGIGLLGDLAVGIDPDGADGWQWQDVLARGVRVGAPPDAFNTRGQDWGLPPFVPWKLRALGYEPFTRTLRAAMRHLGALRIDHVMGLFRLFWIPQGGTPIEGTYVRTPGSELLDIVALESARANVVIVGEDLGTVEDGMREQLAERGLLSYRVGWFEDAPPAQWPAQALAALTTHDLPTLAGVWTGVDGTSQERTRLAAFAGVEPDEPVEDVAVAAHRALGSTPSMIVLGTLDDALGVIEPPNVPGTTTERSNWSLALPAPVDDFEADRSIEAVARALREGRETPSQD